MHAGTGPFAFPASQQTIERGKAATPNMERLTGIEPAYQAWEASALPLSYSRVGTAKIRRSPEQRCSHYLTLPLIGDLAAPAGIPRTQQGPLGEPAR